MGFIFGSGKKAAKIQAAATLQSAEQQAQSDRWAAKAAQQTQETLLAQNKMAQYATEILSKKTGTLDVQLAPEAPATETDPKTGRRRNPRNRFGFVSGQSGISLR